MEQVASWVPCQSEPKSWRRFLRSGATLLKRLAAMCDVKVNCLQGNVCRKAITLFGKSFFTNEHFSLCIQHTPGLKLFMMKIFHIPPFMCECVDSCAFSALPLSVKSGSVTLSSSVYVLFVLWNCRLGLQFAWHMTQPESHNSFSPPIQNSSSYTACRFIGPLQLKPNGYAATFSKNPKNLLG